MRLPRLETLHLHRSCNVVDWNARVRPVSFEILWAHDLLKHVRLANHQIDSKSIYLCLQVFVNMWNSCRGHVLHRARMSKVTGDNLHLTMRSTSCM